MKLKLMQPVELTDSEIDVVSGGSFVGVNQRNGEAEARQRVTTRNSGGGSATTYSAYNSAYQSNYNTGSVTNSGNVS
jgi:hypothetical protein